MTVYMGHCLIFALSPAVPPVVARSLSAKPPQTVYFLRGTQLKAIRAPLPILLFVVI